MEGEVLPLPSQFDDILQFIPKNDEMVESDPTLSLISQAITSLRESGEMSLEAKMAMDKLIPLLANTDKAERSFAIVMDDFLRDYEFIKVDSFVSIPSLYIWYRSKKEGSDLVFRPLSEPLLKEMLTDYYIRNKQGCLASKVNTAAETLRHRIPYHISEISNRVIKVSRDLYFDTKTGRLSKRLDTMGYFSGGDGPDGRAVCFRALFDSTGDHDAVPISAVHFEQYELNAIVAYLKDHPDGFSEPDVFVEEIKTYFNESTLPPEDFQVKRDYLVATARKYYAPLNFFWVAADYNLGRYNDLIKTFMLEFQYVKIGYFFYFIGEKVNGKSAMQRCRHLLLGTNNTVSLSAPKLCSWDYSVDIAKAMSNAPAEDSDFDASEVDGALETLKCMATHEKISLRMKNQPGGIPFTPNFLSFFPRNKIPDFGSGDGLQAFVSRRIKIIHFVHDFSKESNNGHDFAKETFTPEFYSAMLPLLLGQARYYLGKPVTFSEESEGFATKMGSIMDPATYFLTRMYYWFDNLGSIKFVSEQAKLFFIDQGVSNLKEKLESVREKVSRLSDAKPRYAGRRQIPGTKAYTDKDIKGRGKKTPAVDGRTERLKMFAPDAKLAVLGNQSPEEYYASLDPDSVEGNYAHSIITILDDFEMDDDVKRNPVTMQMSMLEKDAEEFND